MINKVVKEDCRFENQADAQQAELDARFHRAMGSSALSHRCFRRTAWLKHKRMTAATINDGVIAAHI